MKTYTAETIKVHYPEVSDSLIFLFCGYVVCWYLQIGIRFPILGSIRFEFIYAIVLTLLALLCVPKKITNIPLLKYVYLYFIVIFIQIPFSYDINTSWDVLVDRIIKYAFMSFFIVCFVRSPKHLKYFLAAFLLACMKMGQEGLVGRITGGLIWENQEIMRLHGATPNYRHPNSFSGMALGTLPFIYCLWPLSNKYIKAILAILAILSLNIIIYTGSRAGYIGIAALICYLITISNNKVKITLSLILCMTLIMPMLPSQYIDRFNTIFANKEHEDGSVRLRKEILIDSLQIFSNHPFGIGVSAFPKMRMDTFGRIQDTHNLYLEIATNLGVQGLIIFTVLIYKLISTLNNIKANISHIFLDNETTSNNDTLSGELKLIDAVSTATIGFIVIRLALGLFGMDLYEIYWWFAIGITISLYAMSCRICETIKEHKLTV